MILEAKNIHKTFSNGFKTLSVLRGIDFSLAEGEIVTIMGPSGSGKSTLLNILGTLDQPTTGTLLINGHDVSTLPDLELAALRNRSIGFVFQFHHLLPEFTALENVLIPSLIGGGSQERNSRALELLEYVGLSDRSDHYPSELSGGERLRIAVLRALINRPQIILADEPTGNLDEANASKLINLFRLINHDFKQSLVITTHNPAVAAIGDRQLELESGILKPAELTD
ncbi:MAG: ABC transporter ATP-binding protein [Candidatus Neomarinimicrobiota bacterium]